MNTLTKDNDPIIINIVLFKILLSADIFLGAGKQKQRKINEIQTLDVAAIILYYVMYCQRECTDSFG